MTSGAPLTPVAQHLLSLQRSAGNRATARLAANLPVQRQDEQELADKPPLTGQSSTTVNPPKRGTKNFTGTFKDVHAAASTWMQNGIPAGDVKTGISSQKLDTWEPPDGGDSIVVKATIVVDSSLESPAWSGKDTACELERNTFDTWAGSVRTHEDGHVAIDKADLATLHKGIEGMEESAADAEIDRRFKAVDSKHQAHDTNSPPGTLNYVSCETEKVP